MKKIRLLFISTLIIMCCTGCTVEYNINITKNNIEETINVTDYIKENRTKNDILKHYNMWYPTYVNYIKNGESIEIEDFSNKVDGIEYHAKTIKELNNGYKYSYNYTYPINDYYDSYVLASTFADTTVQKTGTNLVLKTSDKNFLCNHNYFEETKINITIDEEVYKLKYTNADRQSNNTYTWNLDRSNCNNSEIILTLDIINNNTNNPNQKDNKKNNILNNISYYIFFLLLILLIYLAYKWFTNFKDKNNDID